MEFVKKSMVVILSCWLPLAALSTPSASGTQSGAPDNVVAKQAPEELQQLVAPIALYPDELVSQVLAGATYPTEVVEADRWLQEHSNLKGKDLADEVDKQPWDPSIKALAQFPSVLANMDKNLSWASALGEAYVNQPQDVMAAVQAMRQRAKDAGNLNSNKQEKVGTHDRTIVIEPAQPDVVYLPTYDPWIAYGAPLVAWPGWYWYPGLYVAGPGIAFGLGFGIGFFGGFGWGWHHWGVDWGHRAVIFDHHEFASRSRTFYGGHAGFHDFGAARGYGGFHNGGFRGGQGFHGSPNAHGFASHAQPGLHSGAFGGFDHGGAAHSFASRGRSSFGGGSHGGGGRH
jgi:hypothetical protein